MSKVALASGRQGVAVPALRSPEIPGQDPSGLDAPAPLRARPARQARTRRSKAPAHSRFNRGPGAESADVTATPNRRADLQTAIADVSANLERTRCVVCRTAQAVESAPWSLRG